MSIMGLITDKDKQIKVDEKLLEAAMAKTSSKSVRYGDLEYMLELLNELEKREVESGRQKWYQPGTAYSIDKLPKHREFFRQGLFYKIRMAMGGNRTSKSVTSAFEVACHLTRDYPDWWEGHRFSGPINCLVAGGKNAEACRDTVQKQLLGPLGRPGEGMLTRGEIRKTYAGHGASGLIETAEIKGIDGRISNLIIKSYGQGRDALKGLDIDLVWLDEEPELDFYTEALMRTVSTNGLVLLSMTPQDSLTAFILHYSQMCDVHPDSVRPCAPADEYIQGKAISYLVQYTWNDSPWLTEKMKEDMRKEFPYSERDFREKGIPTQSTGNVYQYRVDDLLAPEDFRVQPWHKKIIGMDVGGQCTAAVLLAWDTDTDIVYLVDEYYGLHNKTPEENAMAIRRWGDWIPIAIDPAANQRSQVDGRRLMQEYIKLGLKVRKADNAVTAGINKLQIRMGRGGFKIVRGRCPNFIREYSIYRYDENGKIIKENDHCLTGSTLVHTSNGPIPIRDLVGTSGSVLTAASTMVKFTNCRLTRKDAGIVRVHFEDGTFVDCTPDHKLMTQQGWVEAQYSVGKSIVHNHIDGDLWNQLLFTPIRNKNSTGHSTTCAGSISNETGSGFTEKYGNTSMGKSQKDTTYTMKMRTEAIIKSLISGLCRAVSTCLSTIKEGCKTFLRSAGKQQLSGTSLKTGESGTKNTTRNLSTRSTKNPTESATIVVKSTCQEKRTQTPFAATLVNPHTEGQSGLTMLTECASSAGVYSQLTSIQNQLIAQKNAVRYLAVERIEKRPNEDVYCMHVPSVNCFAVNNGAIVHNCVDAWRYAHNMLHLAITQPTMTPAIANTRGSMSWF